MQAEVKRRIQTILIVAMLVAAARTGWIFYERSREADQAIEQEKERQRKKDTLDADYYVTPRKLYAYDLAGAQELAKTPVWVRTGYGTFYYPFDPSTKHADFAHDAGLLGPLEKLRITSVVYDRAPKAPGQKQIMAVFSKDGKHYAFPIGAQKGSDFTLYANDMLFLDDPHGMYKHWSPEVWDAIAKHEVHAGMNELQADCAVGLGLLEGSGTGEERTLRYANGGTPLTVTFRKGRAVEVKKGE
jgi:hypothetical protein